MGARKDVHRIAISQATRTENKGPDGSYRRDTQRRTEKRGKREGSPVGRGTPFSGFEGAEGAEEAEGTENRSMR